MITIIQRVSHANVCIDQQVVGEIQQGIMALIAVERTDTEKQADRLLERILNYRIFADENDRMNLSLKDIQGGLLLVPQFTLAADTNSGNRPSFTPAATPEQGEKMFAYLQDRAKKSYSHVAFGRFGADMKVTLLNDGPVTFTLKT